MDGWMDGWMGGWVDGRESRVKDCLQQSKIVYTKEKAVKAKTILHVKKSSY
jgi:hypothetical protein